MKLATRTRGRTGFRPLLVPPAQSRSSADDDASSAPDLERVWDRDGSSAYKLACALLGDEAAAVRVVTRAMVDLALVTDGDADGDTLRFLGGRVYRHSQEVSVEPANRSGETPVMVWLRQLAQLQRACLALCLFGGHSHREAAVLLGEPPMKVAELLRSGLLELGNVAAGRTATSG